jgi:hypothetical protein
MPSNGNHCGLSSSFQLMPIIIATQEAVIRRISIQSQSVAKSLWDPFSKNPIQNRASRVAQVVSVYLASMRPWVQTPVPPNKKKIRKEGRGLFDSLGAYYMPNTERYYFLKLWCQSFRDINSLPNFNIALVLFMMHGVSADACCKTVVLKWEWFDP